MATTRRTAKEIRIEKIVNLKNELNQLQGKPCVDDEFTNILKEYKLYELADMIENLGKRIEDEKRIQKVNAFFEGEGCELKARIEQRREELRQEFQAIQQDMMELANDSFAGTAWTVESAEASFLSAFITISIHSDETGKAVHGTETTLKFERAIFGTSDLSSRPTLVPEAQTTFLTIARSHVHSSTLRWASCSLMWRSCQASRIRCRKW